MKKVLMTGNEALARGAWEAGVRFASSYPGTPATEILENLAEHYGDDIHAEWAPNEKVALEAAAGASIAGVRSLASMKHVGLNVAADPLFTFAYTGVGGGMVVVSADEPGQHSSQNEQDNRHYAKMAKIPMLEPADSQEAKDFPPLALDISEAYDTPVLIRVTTRLCHSTGIVEPGERAAAAPREYVKNVPKYIIVPAFARGRRRVVEERLAALAEFSENTPLNVVSGSGDIGVIASGLAYCYAREVFGDTAAYLKLGFTHPLPARKIRDFCAGKKTVYIIEENDPYIEDFVKGLGLACHGRDTFPPFGELTPDVLRAALTGRTLPVIDHDRADIVPRPPTLCAGCPHRGFFYEAGRRRQVVVSGDVGCYTLGFAWPWSAMDFTICMGAGFSAGHGAQTAFDLSPENGRRVISVMGDSTFFHSGLNSLVEVLYNGGRTVNVILDNRATAMTGHQPNPASGRRADQSPAPPMDIEKIVRALGAKNVRVVNPNILSEVREALDWALALDEASVIISRWPCVLKRPSEAETREFGPLVRDPYQVDHEKCVGCKACLRGGCPAISVDRGLKKSAIDRLQCAGCSICAQICPQGAIVREAA